MGNYISGRSSSKRLVIILCLIIHSFTSYAYEMVIPDTLIAGRTITLKIQTEIPTTEEFEVDDIEFPEDIILISGPVKRAYYGRIDGRNRRLHQVTWTIRSRTSGIFEIPDVTMYSGEETFTVESPLLKIFRTDEVNNNFPLIVDWSKEIKKEVFVGESLPLIVEVHNLEELNFPDKINFTNPRKGEVVEVSGLGDINPERVGDNDLYRVAVASWIYTPFEAGKVTIPGVRVDINGLTRVTEELVIDVKPLPTVNVTGGVGEFLISSEISSSQVTPEDVFSFKVKISGQGNLPYIKFPKLNYSDIILIEKVESEYIEPGDSGFLGWREVEYKLQALEPGIKELSLSDVSWLNYLGEEVFYSGAVSHINVISVKVIEEDISPFLSFLTTPEIIEANRIYLYKTPLMWLSVLFSIIIITIISISRLLRGKSGKKVLLMSMVFTPLFLMSISYVKGFEYQDELSMADSYIESGEYLGALDIYDNLEGLENNYGLYINRALLWDKLDRQSEAVYNIRIAERLLTNSGKINDIKSWLAESDEYELKQAKTANSIDPDYLFILLIIFVNILIYLIIRLYRYRNITTFSLFFTVLLFTLLSGVLLVVADVKNSIPSGVISTGGADLIKVPNENALEWMNLSEGNCVYIRGEWENLYLIETEYGLKGWVDKSSLLVLEER